MWKALIYLWGLSKSMLCLHRLSFSPNYFFLVAEICKYEIFLVQNLSENRSVQTFAVTPKLKENRTNKQTNNKKDTIWI